jgi:hypothetical protein
MYTDFARFLITTTTTTTTTAIQLSVSGGSPYASTSEQIRISNKQIRVNTNKQE